MRNFVFLFCALLLLSCSENAENTEDAGSYFDLKGFFEKEASRLQTKNAAFSKSLSRNSVKQTKKVSGINWKNELSLFTESDINKPAWKNSYKIIRNKEDIIYQAIDSGLRTREIRISKNKNGSVQKILIENQTINRLYQSFEKLIYISDSSYQISKKQHVLLIGDNQYLISGRFK